MVRARQMLSIRIDQDVYGLDDPIAAELLRRLADATPLEEGPEASTTLAKLRSALDSDEAASLDDADLALIGVVVEAWAVEVEGDLAGDLEELRYAISDRLG
jgi:hypothetical protein